MLKLVSSIVLLALAVIAVPVSAEVQTASRTAKGDTGKDIRLGVYVNISANCKSGPLPTIRLVDPPKNGKVTVRQINVRATNYKQCLAIEVPGLVAFYRSEPNFKGADELRLEVSFPTVGKRFRISVCWSEEDLPWERKSKRAIASMVLFPFDPHYATGSVAGSGEKWVANLLAILSKASASVGGAFVSVMFGHSASYLALSAIHRSAPSAARTARSSWATRAPYPIAVMPNMWQLVCVAGLSIAVMLAPSAARPNEDFYAGKTLTIIAGFPPGGGVDGEMRVLTRYFAKYIPGRPAIVARNMPGAGGIILGNTLYNVTVADGLTVGMPGRSGFLLSNVVPQNGIKYDLSKFSYIGGAGSAPNALWLHRRTASHRWMSSSAPANGS